MRRCESCGSLWQDSKTHCLDCGERLSRPFSEEELKACEEETKPKNISISGKLKRIFTRNKT